MAGPDEVASAAGIPSAAPRRAEGVPVRPRAAGDFENSYASTPPWDIDRPQPALVALAESGEVQGRVLDVGCGTGEHALLAARLGLDAVGVDAARAAIAKAEIKARERGVSPRFVVGDALDLPALALGQFDTVIDSGVFHVFDDEDRGRFVASLAAVMSPGSRYCMLCFSELQQGDWGPRRVTEAEIRASFTDGWRIDSIDPARMIITWLPDGVHAWRAVITRT